VQGLPAGQCLRRHSLPFVNVVDGNCPELLFRELLDGVVRQPATMNVPLQNWSWWLKFGACVTGCVSGVIARDMDAEVNRRC
jgi:hypothetical protein